MTPNRFTSLVVVACLAVPAASFAQSTTSAAKTPAADPAGTWTATVNTQNGPMAVTLKLQKSGDKLGGTIGSAQGETPVEASIEGKTLTVWFNYSANGNSIPIVLSATID